MKTNLMIGGNWEESTSRERYRITNPATEEEICTVPFANAEDVNRAVLSAEKGLTGSWRKITPSQRGRLLNLLAENIEKNKSELAEIETLNVGKPLRESLANVDAAIKYFRYYSGAADKLEGESIPLGQDYFNFTVLEPLGVTGHIIPWNFPLSIACRSVAPALAAGNTTVIKPAALTPLTALKLAELCMDVGFPEGVVNVITGSGSEAGEAIVRHPSIRGITITGSVSTGKNILKMAADGVKTVVAELGGKNPQIVFSDADLNMAVDQTMKAAFKNAGQVCSASTRLIVERSIHDDYLDRLISRVQGVSIGPGIENYDMGPLISKSQYNEVMDYISIGTSEGAGLVVGGNRPSNLGRGYFIQPTIFDNVRSDMRIAQEEIFGPVLCILTFETEQEALNLANNVSYGLVAGIFTKDITRALRLARDIQAGQVWINEWFIGGIQTPFGGYKESGLGREKGMAGLMNYVQIKNIGIRF